MVVQIISSKPTFQLRIKRVKLLRTKEGLMQRAQGEIIYPKV